MRKLLATALVLVVFPAAPAADGDKINAAIKNGVSYLLSQPLTNQQAAGGHGIGPMCLAGLALLESEVRQDHASLIAIRTAVRDAAVREVGTYQVCLAIIFLDRYGDPADVNTIQILGARLLAGQTLLGGWNYVTFDMVMPEEEARIRQSMNSPPTKGKLCVEASRIIGVLASGRRPGVALGGDDNSNTQFGVLGLWVARRNGIPADMGFYKLQQRFLRSQSPTDNGWGYTTVVGGSSPSMTCAGLLALAAAKACFEQELVASRPDDGKPANPEDDDPFLKPPPPGSNKPGEDDPGLPPPPPVDPLIVQARDKAIERALKSLGGLLQQASGISVGNAGNLGGIDDLYFYWSLERVAVAFGLETIGSVDWYKWGSEAILKSQAADGSWAGNYQSSIISTSFALLFLKKANFANDLTRKIAGKVTDPGGAELRGGRGAAISPKGTPREPKPDPNDPKGVNVNAVRRTTEADKIAELLVTCSDRDWKAKLRLHRDTQGPQHTAGLVKAIGQLEGRRLYETREALAERLTRMTQETLKRMLVERDAEIRRAACLAVAMKDEKFLFPDVIERIQDPNDLVSRAAKAALNAASGLDHGPPVGANDEEKRKAVEAWTLWYELEKRKQ